MDQYTREEERVKAQRYDLLNKQKKKEQRAKRRDKFKEKTLKQEQDSERVEKKEAERRAREQYWKDIFEPTKADVDERKSLFEKSQNGYGVHLKWQGLNPKVHELSSLLAILKCHLGIPTHMEMEDLQRGISQDLEYIMQFVNTNGKNMVERLYKAEEAVKTANKVVNVKPRQAILYVLNFTENAASRIIDGNLNPINTTFITKEFADIRDSFTKILANKIVGPEYEDVRPIITEILNRVQKCQDKVDALSKLMSTTGTTWLGSQYHLGTYTRSPTIDDRVVQVQNTDLGNGLKEIFTKVATIALGMFDRANESQCRVIVKFDTYQLGIFSIITAITTAGSNITIYDQVITHRQPFHYLKPVHTLQVGDAGTVTGFKNRLQSWISQSFAQNPAYTTLHTVMTSRKR